MAAVALFDERVDLAGEQVNPRQQADGAATLVLVIAAKVAPQWRQIRRRL